MVTAPIEPAKGAILVVDDDRTSSALLQARLEKRGYKVTTHDIGTGVEEMVELISVDLVLLDIMLPDTSGLDVLRKIRAKYSKAELPVIMVTAKDTPEDITGALQDGANDYLAKPINIDVAIARINTQLSMRDLYRENLQRQRQDSINAMVIAFNHQINNPLAIALGNLTLGIEKNDAAALQKADAAMRRIAEIIRKINDLTKGEGIEVTRYTDSAQMVKIKD
jgi:DNA-binding response OmpR family regulator